MQTIYTRHDYQILQPLKRCCLHHHPKSLSNTTRECMNIHTRFEPAKACAPLNPYHLQSPDSRKPEISQLRQHALPIDRMHDSDRQPGPLLLFGGGSICVKAESCQNPRSFSSCKLKLDKQTVMVAWYE